METSTRAESGGIVRRLFKTVAWMQPAPDNLRPKETSTRAESGGMVRRLFESTATASRSPPSSPPPHPGFQPRRRHHVHHGRWGGLHPGYSAKPRHRGLDAARTSPLCPMETSTRAESGGIARRLFEPAATASRSPPSSPPPHPGFQPRRRHHVHHGQRGGLHPGYSAGSRQRSLDAARTSPPYARWKRQRGRNPGAW